MQISVEKTSELSRKLTVSVPETVLQEKITQRLAELGHNVKLHGFRPGKVPAKVVGQMYGAKVQEEVINDFINSSFPEALKDLELNPVSPPHIQFVEEPGFYKYTAEFEIYPEIHLDALSGLALTRPVSSVSEENIDSVIEKLRAQNTLWHTVTRPGATGDRLTLSFSGVCEGDNFTNGRVDDFVVVIGAKQMIPGFEDNLLGLETGSSKTFELTFPEHYNEAQLAGKVATFEVNVIKIEAPTLPEIDETFIKTYGVEDGLLTSFRDDVRINIEREMERVLRGKLKDVVIAAVYETMQFAVPNALIDAEIADLQKRYEEMAKRQNKNPENLQQLPRELFEEQAKRRTALALIFNAIVHNNELKVDEDKVLSTVESLAKSYEHPEQVISWYYADKKRLFDVQQMVLEGQAIDWIVAQAQVSEETIDFNDVMSGQQRS